MREQILDGEAEGRVDQARSDLAKRLQNKAAKMQPGVGDGKAVFSKDVLIPEQNVEIDGAWAVRNGAHAPKFSFDAAKGLKELEGAQFGADAGGRIEKLSLILEADGLGFIQPGQADQFAGAGEAGKGVQKNSPAVAEIPAKTDPDVSHVACG